MNTETPQGERHALANRAGRPDTPWWHDAITYQLYIRSFADGNADGMGDLSGIRRRLKYIAELGVDALWINPCYPSPQADAGYDVADYRDIEPTFGTLPEAEALIAEAHALGLKVLLDIVPNHTSDEHPWFRAACAAGPGAAERQRYIFRPGRGPAGDEPPNDWQAVFGGPAWTRITEADGSLGPFYLHLFDPKQPDLNWSHPEVRQEFLDILRFWFDRNVDGFRIDVAHGLCKDPALPDLGLNRQELLGVPRSEGHPHWDRPEVHEIYRTWRALADAYDPPRVFVAEAWVASSERLARYIRPDELHTAFDFDFLRAPYRAAALRECVQESLETHRAVGAPVVWLLSNHDLTRHVTRLGRADAATVANPLRRRPPQPVDVELGRRRARALLLFELALPGGVYLYQGEELGLEEVEDLPEALLQDPTWVRSGFTDRGRDGCRVPLPWHSDGASFGFGATQAWLPQPEHWGLLSVENQLQQPGSMLRFYREALRLRKRLPALGSGDGSLPHWLELGEHVLGLRREPGFTCIVNLGPSTVQLTHPGRLLLASQPEVNQCTELPADTAVWLVDDSC